MEHDKLNYEWCYISGRVNVLECQLLSMNFYERLLSSQNIGNLFANLNSTHLKKYFTHVKHLYEFEMLLDDYYYDRLYEIRTLAPDTVFCDYFLIKNDVINLKNILKASISDREPDRYLRGTIDKVKLNDVWQVEVKSFPEALNEAVLYFKSEMKYLKKAWMPFVIDLIFDSAYLRYIEFVCRDNIAVIIRRYLAIYQITRVIKIIMRVLTLKLDKVPFEKYFLAGLNANNAFRELVSGSTQLSEKMLCEMLVETHCNTSPAEYENIVKILAAELSKKISYRYEIMTDNYLMDIISPAKYTPFGAEKVFGYLCGLTIEFFNLKLVIGGLIRGVENNLLRERLRKTYV